MSKLAKALQKMGLVQVEELPLQDELPIVEVPAIEATPAPEAVLPIEQCTIDEAISFEQIYADAGVPTSPYPAEKLLKLLEGLQAMQPDLRKTTVSAIDAADDAWSIEDPVRDAQRKIQALRDAQASASHKATSVESHGKERLAQIERRKHDAVGSVRQQIAELEALMERELQKAAEAAAAVTAEIRATADASIRARRQMDAEISRLQSLVATFASQGASDAPQT
jgi:hypothetical protein